MQETSVAPRYQHDDDEGQSATTGGEEEHGEHNDSIQILHVRNDPAPDRQIVSEHAPVTSPVLSSVDTRQMNALIFQEFLRRGIDSSKNGLVNTRAGSMKKALNAYKEALQLYELCHTYYISASDHCLDYSSIAGDDCDIEQESSREKLPPVSLELSIVQTIQIMASFHDHGLVEAPSVVEAHEVTINLLLKLIKRNNHPEINCDILDCLKTPQRPTSTKSARQLSPISVLSELNTAPEPLSRVCNVVILTQHERIRLISTSLNALAKLYFEEEESKPEVDDNKENALIYFQEALNFLHKVYPLSTSSLFALGDEALEIDFIDRDNSKHESSTGARFHIDLRIDTGNTLMQMGELLCFRGDYENAAIVFEKALTVRREKYESDDKKEVMDSCYALGMAYEQYGDFDMAMISYDIVLESIKKTSGHESTDAAKLCSDKSRILRQQGDVAGSFLRNERAVAIYRNHLSRCGSEISQQLIEALKRRGELLIDMKEIDQSILSYLEMIKIQKSYFGPDHPDVAQTLLLLGDLYVSTNEFTDAKTSLMEALDLFSEFGTGPNDPDLKLTKSKINEIINLEEEDKREINHVDSDMSLHEENNRNQSNNHNTCTIMGAEDIFNFEDKGRMKMNHKVKNGSIHEQKHKKESNNFSNNGVPGEDNSCALVEEEQHTFCKVVATKALCGDDDDGVSQITFIDHAGTTAGKIQRKRRGRQREPYKGDCLITSRVSEVVGKIVDATGKLLIGSDCHRHLLADNMSMQSENKINVAVDINDDASAIESTLLGVSLLSSASEDHTQVSIDDSCQDSTIDESLFGVGLVSVQYDNESQIGSQIDTQITPHEGNVGCQDSTIDESLFGVGLVSVQCDNESQIGSQIDTQITPHEGNIGCANMDDLLAQMNVDNLLAQMNVVTCEMEIGGNAKTFKEILQVEKKHDKSGSEESSLKSSSKKKLLLDRKVRAQENLLLERRVLLGSNHSEVLDIMISLGKLYLRNKEHNKAISTYLGVQVIQIEEKGQQSNEVALTCMKIGDSYLAQAKYDSAMQNYLKAMDIQLKIFGKNHPIVASTLNSMGLVDLERGDFDVAMDYLQHALRIQQVHLAPNEHNPDVSQTLVNIGAVYYKERNSFSKSRKKEDTYKQFIEKGTLGKIAFAHGERGEYIMAMHFYAEVLQLLRHRGEDRSLPGIVMTLNCLGNLSAKTGRYVVAKDYHNEALNALDKSSEANEVDINDTLAYLGVIHYYSGNLQTALTTFKEIRPKQKRLLGTNHPRVARTKYYEGVVNSVLCKYDEATRNLNEALKMQLAVLQKYHPDTLDTCLAIGMVHLELDRFDAALTQFQEVLDGQKTIFGEKHPDIVQTLNSLGLVQIKRGETKIAMRYFIKSHKLGLKLLGPDHPFVATSLFRIGNLHEQAGRYLKARSSYKECIRIRIECLGDQHYEVAYALHSMGTLYAVTRKFDDAISKFTVARTIATQSLGEKHPFIASIHVGRSSVFLRRCHFDEAKSELEIALKIYKEFNLPDIHSKLQKIKKDIARVEHEEDLCV